MGRLDELLDRVEWTIDQWKLGPPYVTQPVPEPTITTQPFQTGSVFD